MVNKDQLSEEEKMLLDAVDSYNNQNLEGFDLEETSKELQKLYVVPETYLAYAAEALTDSHANLNKFMCFALAAKEKGGTLLSDSSIVTVLTSMSAHLALVSTLLKEERKK